MNVTGPTVVGAAVFLCSGTGTRPAHLITIPPLVTATAGIQGGFTAYSKAEVQEWEKTLKEAHEQLKIQDTFREHVSRSLASCCPGNVPALLGQAPDSQAQNLQEANTILETEVLGSANHLNS